MSNRRITPYARKMRSYRSSGGPAVRTDGAGNVFRGEGRNNFPFGPRAAGGSRSILSIHRNATRPRKTDRPDFSAMTRAQLRVVAKNLGLTGYGHMTKAELVKAVSA